VIVDFPQAQGQKSLLPSHLHMRVGQSTSFPRLNPFLKHLWKLVSWLPLMGWNDLQRKLVFRGSHFHVLVFPEGMTAFVGWRRGARSISAIWALAVAKHGASKNSVADMAQAAASVYGEIDT